MKTLKLTLSRAPFDAMVTGEKCEEFRIPSDWIRSRLFDRDGNPKSYDRIQYTNGYGSSRPRFTTDFQGFELVTSGIKRQYSTGFNVVIDQPCFVIKHSKVLTIENYPAVTKI